MGLGVPVGQMADEAAAVGARRIGFGRVFGFGGAEDALPVGALGEFVGVVDGVSAFVAQEHLAPFGGASFDFQHLAEF